MRQSVSCDSFRVYVEVLIPVATFGEQTPVKLRGKIDLLYHMLTTRATS